MHIGLIAVSGVRACDKELLALGLTLPGFVERSKVIASLPSLGLLTLAGLTPSHHQQTYVEMPEPDAAPDPLPRFDLVAISTFSAQAREAYALADRYRAMGVPVVMGGLHVSALPDEAAAHADAVVIGPGESVWPRLLRDAEAGRLQPRYGPEPFDLADAPMPAFELLEIDRYNRLTVQTSRGCPFQCEFCASSILLSPRYQQKPAGKVLAEIDRIRRLWPRPFIELADDNTFVNKPYWKELLPQITRRRIRWFTETDISSGEDDELLSLMRDSGCAQVLIGLESPEPTGLDHLELRANWKHHRWPDYRRLVRNIQGHGIRVNGCFILGLDGHGPDIFDQVYDFARELELFDVQITLPTAFPGTPLHDRLSRAGRLIQPDNWDTCTLFDLNFHPTPMTREQLTRGFRDLGMRLYDQPLTRWRRDNFNRKYRRARRPIQETPR